MSKKQFMSDPMTATIRKRLEGFILFYRLDTTVEEVEVKIYHSRKEGKLATREYNQWRMDKMEDVGIKITQNMLDVMTEVWNHFPQEKLGGKTPHQKFIELYGK